MRDVGLIAARAVIAGVFIVGFSLLGTALKPKRFAGLFSAAPSIALANLIVVTLAEGDRKATGELHAMTYGAFGFVLYCAVERLVLPRVSAARASVVSTAGWLLVALPAYFWVLK
jgi:hypothetical protein